MSDSLSMPSGSTLAQIVSTVTSTMFGLSFSAVTGADEPTKLRSAVLPIAGAQPLTVALSADDRSCAQLGAAMFMCDASDVDGEMMNDSLKELLNMTAGQLTRALRLDQALGLPRIVDDASIARFEEGGRWHVATLKAGDVAVIVSLAPEIV